jgi:hypothetical protein
LNPNYNAEVPAVLGYKGRVIDVTVRYQGSPYNRHNGVDITTWPYIRPDTGPLKALSWTITIPRYDDIDGNNEVILNKMWDGCVFFTNPLLFETQRMLGIPGMFFSRGFS